MRLATALATALALALIGSTAGAKPRQCFGERPTIVADQSERVIRGPIETT